MARFDINVNSAGIIEDAKVKVYGCGSAIASASFASEKIKGLTIAQAQGLTNRDIASELNLPPVKLHCSLLAEEAIKGAIANYLQKNNKIKTKISKDKK